MNTRFLNRLALVLMLSGLLSACTRQEISDAWGASLIGWFAGIVIGAILIIAAVLATRR